MLKLAKLLLVMAATKTTAVIKTCIIDTSVGNSLNHHTIFVIHHVQCGKTNQSNIVEETQDFKRSSHARLQVFERF